MRILKLILFPVAVLGLVSSCGILGSKKQTKKNVALQQQTGCLDELGNRLDRFLDGSISEAAWLETWTCLEDTLDTFENLVRPSDDRGFTRNDIQGLARTFLVSKRPVTAEFVDATFAVKASLFGGHPDYFTKQEIGKLRRIISLVKSDTPAFIPLLREKRENPRAENLRPLVQKIAAFGANLADRLSPENNPTLTRERTMQFMAELGKMSLNGSERKYREWGNFIIEVKNLMMNGDATGIAGADWKEMLRYGGEVGAVVFGLSSVTSDEPAFQLELGEAARTSLSKIFAHWNGKVPATMIERVVAAAPTDILPDRAEEFQIGIMCSLRRRLPSEPENSLCKPIANCPRTGCRPALPRLLGSGAEDGLDISVLDTIFGIYRTGTRAKLHLEAMLEGVKEELTPREFAVRANDYAAGRPLTEIAEVNRLKRISADYAGMFPEGSPEMNYGDISRHSQNNLGRFSFYEAVAEKLLGAYATKKSPLKGTVNDLYFLVGDWEMILTSLGMVHPLKKDVYLNRFREANLFVIPGNGDDYMDVKETTTYIASLMSISKLSRRIRQDIFLDDPVTGRRAACRPIGTDTCMKLPQYSVQCFRDHFYSNLDTYWQNFPMLLEDYRRMTTAEQKKIQRAYEAATKLSGLYDETDVTNFDVDNIAGVPHFMEGLMQKFDNHGGKRDGYLDRTEIDGQVWPTFKNEFKKITSLPGGGLLDWVNKPLFIYLLKNGGLPFKCQTAPKIGEIGEFVAWMGLGGHRTSFKIRRDRMFTVFEELSKPIMPGCKGYVPPAVCKGTDDLSSAVSTTSMMDGTTLELSPEMEMMLQGAISDEEKRELSQ